VPPLFPADQYLLKAVSPPPLGSCFFFAFPFFATTLLPLCPPIAMFFFRMLAFQTSFSPLGSSFPIVHWMVFRVMNAGFFVSGDCQPRSSIFFPICSLLVSPPFQRKGSFQFPKGALACSVCLFPPFSSPPFFTRQGFICYEPHRPIFTSSFGLSSLPVPSSFPPPPSFYGSFITPLLKLPSPRSHTTISHAPPLIPPYLRSAPPPPGELVGSSLSKPLFCWARPTPTFSPLLIPDKQNFYFFPPPTFTRILPFRFDTSGSLFDSPSMPSHFGMH